MPHQNLEAFAGGLHSRLGEESRVSLLNDQILLLIAEEVLDGIAEGCRLFELWKNKDTG